jgi:hypothetical protein
MAQKKAHEVDSWLARPDSRTFLVLIYGPDRGLVSERGKAYAQSTGLPLDDPFSVVKLDGADVEKGDGRLSQEARTVPMFSDRRLLWVRNAAGQKGLADEVKTLLAEPPRDATILIEAGDLKKGAPLRSAVETAEGAMALPCYADDGRDIEAVIDDELRKANLTMTLDARQALRRNLGGDRRRHSRWAYRGFRHCIRTSLPGRRSTLPRPLGGDAPVSRPSRDARRNGRRQPQRRLGRGWRKTSGLLLEAQAHRARARALEPAVHRTRAGKASERRPANAPPPRTRLSARQTGPARHSRGKRTPFAAVILRKSYIIQ